MHAKDVIRHTLGASANLLGMYTKDLSDAEWFVRPVEGANHIAWQIGHLISSESRMLDCVKAGSSPALPEGFHDAHKKDTAGSNDPKKFLTKDQYLDLFSKQREATLKVLNDMTDQELDAPAPDKLKMLAQTMGTLMNVLGTHILMHVGQFVVTRRKVGKTAMF